MALITCNECGKQISNEARACPGCGAKIPKKVGPIGIVFAVIIGLAMFQCTMQSEKSKDEKAAIQAAKSPEQIKRETEEKAAEELRFQKTVIFLNGLKKSARNPQTFKTESIAANHDASVICVEFRAQNGFGGINKEFAVYAKGKASQDAKVWNKRCVDQSLIDMNHARFAIQ